jgi:hypothetical protein
MPAEMVICECGQVAPAGVIDRYNWWREHRQDDHPHFPINDLLRQECLRGDL